MRRFLNRPLPERNNDRRLRELLGQRGRAGREAVRLEDLNENSDADIVALILATYTQGETQGEAIVQLQSGVTAAQADADAAAAVAQSALDDAAAAQDDIDGFSVAFEGLTVTLDGSGRVSGFLATTWANLDGSGGSVLELLGDVIAQGTIATNRLTVGLQGNWIKNSEFFGPVTPAWGPHDANGAAGAATVVQRNDEGEPYAWLSFPTLSLYQNDGSTTGFYDAYVRPPQDTAGALAPGWAVTAGERVSLSMRVSAHRCTATIRIAFYDGAGAFLSDVNSGNAVGGNFATSSAGPAGSASNPDLWDQLWMLADVPAGAAYARPVIRKGPSGSGDADSEVFIARPMFAKTHDDATAFTPYSPDGTTLIDGDQIRTGSIEADRLSVQEISVISSNLGTFQSAATGERMVITGSKIEVYDSTNTLRVRIGDLSE